jgi:hypothetical protein
MSAQESTQVNYLGIDAPTGATKNIIRILKKLRTTVAVENAGAYREDRNISQIWIDTTWTEQKLDAWLYNTKGIDYVGTFVRTESIEGDLS